MMALTRTGPTVLGPTDISCNSRLETRPGAPVQSSLMHSLGQTRGASRRDHLLHTPDTFVRTPLPGLSGGLAIVHAAPAMGAGFAMMTLEMESGGTLLRGPAQRLIYVLEGQLQLRGSRTPRPHALRPGSFAYVPLDQSYRLEAVSAARLIVIDKAYAPLETGDIESSGADTPDFFTDIEDNIASLPLDGEEDVQVRSLLPASFAFDFAVNTMTFAPGAALAQTEMHYMEHGLLMLEGGGICRLGDAWYPVQAGDFIWISAFCPQWFGALGKQPAKYLVYKDLNRHVLA